MSKNKIYFSLDISLPNAYSSCMDDLLYHPTYLTNPLNGLLKMPTDQTIMSLTPRHFKIVDYAVKGWTSVAIARELNMSNTTISVIMNSPTFKHEFALRRAIYDEKTTEEQVNAEDNVTKILKEGAVKAARKLVGHVDSLEDSISVKSCAEVLDRSGYGKKVDKTTNIIAPTIILTGDDTKRLVESMQMDYETEEDFAKSNEPVEVIESNDPPALDPTHSTGSVLQTSG